MPAQRADEFVPQDPALRIIRDFDNAITALKRHRSTVNAIPHFLQSVNGARRKISQERVPVIRWLIGDVQTKPIDAGAMPICVCSYVVAGMEVVGKVS